MRVKRKDKSIIIEEEANNASTPPRNSRPAGLKNIIEVTEENEPAPLPALSPCKEQENPPLPPASSSCVRRLTKCITNLWRTLFNTPSSYEVDLNSQDLTSIILKLRARKPSAPPLLPPQGQQRRVLVLDLDETLIHTCFSRPGKFDFQSEVEFNGQSTRIYTVKRFGVDAFLFEMSKLYELVVFTASQRQYADKVIDQIDPKRRIAHRLYRQHCVAINKTYFLKNIRALGRRTPDVIIVDDNAIAGLLQPDNFYKIDPFDGNEKDRQLCRLSAFLKHLHGKAKIGNVKAQRKQFEQLEIELSENGEAKEGRSLNQRKRQYQHKKTTSEVEELASKSTEDENQAETTATDMVKEL